MRIKFKVCLYYKLYVRVKSIATPWNIFFIYRGPYTNAGFLFAGSYVCSTLQTP